MIDAFGLILMAALALGRMSLACPGGGSVRTSFQRGGFWVAGGNVCRFV